MHKPYGKESPKVIGFIRTENGENGKSVNLPLWFGTTGNKIAVVKIHVQLNLNNRMYFKLN